jgi:hypothetical protein
MLIRRARTLPTVATLAIVGTLGLFVRHIWRDAAADVHPIRLHVTVGDDAAAKAYLPGCTNVTLRTRDGLLLQAW